MKDSLKYNFPFTQVKSRCLCEGSVFRKIFLFVAFAMILSCKEENTQWVKSQNIGNALGTTYAITYIDLEKHNFQKEIDSVIQVVNQSMSTYLSDSDISKINNGDSTIVVDKMFREVFELSKEIHEKTNGYFDPTVGVLVNAWGFGPGEQLKMDSVKVDSLLKFVGWNKVRLRKNHTITKDSPEIRFDFNAIAKGYAIDCLAAMLSAKGIDNFLVELGGEVVAKGQNVVSQKEWLIGIDDPTDLADRGGALVVRLENKALASSGNYRKFRVDEATGEKYVHTIDPKSGYTKNSNVLSSTVVASDCATADAYATAFMAMPLEDSKMLLKIKEKELDAFMIYLDEEGNTKNYMTPGFEVLVVD